MARPPGISSRPAQSHTLEDSLDGAFGPSETPKISMNVNGRELTEFDQVMPEALRKVMLSKMTCSPTISYSAFPLMWMQTDPQAWAGYHPERCIDVASKDGKTVTE